MSDVETAKRKVYESVSARLAVPEAEFYRAMTLFDIVPVTSEGRVIGGILKRGNELHIGCTERPKGAAMRKYICILREVVAEFGCAVATVMPGNDTALHELQRLGFRLAELKDGMMHMRCEKVLFWQTAYA